MPDGEVIYRPSEWQRTFHAARVWELLGAGAAGPGKTQALLMDAMPIIQIEHERCLNKKHPHRLRWGESRAVVLHLRRTRPMLRDTIMRAKLLFPRIDPDVHWNEEETTFTFKSGLKYIFGHCKDPDSWQQYESQELTALYFDEVNQFNEEQYIRICARVRTTDPVLSQKDEHGRYVYLRIKSCCNPTVRLGNPEEGGFILKDPGWVRRRFVDAEPAGKVIFRKKAVVDGEVVFRERLYLPATIDDNPDKAFRAHQRATMLLTMPEHLVQALLYGDWYVSAASHFAEEWRPRLHIVAPFRVPPDWKFFRAGDWGYKSPGVIGWYAMDEEDGLYLIYEFKFRKMLAEKVAEHVQRIEKKLGLWDERGKRSRITGPLDNQAFREDGRGGLTIAETFAKHGIPWVQAAQGTGSRENNARLIAERLKDHEQETTAPGLMLFSTCKETIMILPSIQTDPNNSEAPLEGGDDHAYDQLQYAVAYASNGRAGIPSPRAAAKAYDPFEDPELDRRREVASADRGGNHYLDDYA